MTLDTSNITDGLEVLAILFLFILSIYKRAKVVLKDGDTDNIAKQVADKISAEIKGLADRITMIETNMDANCKKVDEMNVTFNNHITEITKSVEKLSIDMKAENKEVHSSIRSSHKRIDEVYTMLAERGGK